MKHLICISLSVVVVTSIVAAGVGTVDDPQLSRWTIDGGGVTRSLGGTWELSGTIGQPDAAVMEGSSYVLTGGFWFAVPPCDCDDDGRVSLYDHVEFEACLSGPGAGVTEGCGCFDVDRSHMVDLRDFAVAQIAFTGQ